MFMFGLASIEVKFTLPLRLYYGCFFFELVELFAGFSDIVEKMMLHSPILITDAIILSNVTQV